MEGKFDASPGGKKPQEMFVNFSVDNRPIKVNLHEVNGLFGDIEKYNSQFSLGSMMARMIISRFEPESDEILPPGQTSIGSEEGNQQANSFFVIAKHKKLVTDIGLSLEPVSGKSGTIAGEGESAGAGEMRINIISHEHFTSFLGALEPQQLTTTGLKIHLEKLPTVLSQQILGSYDLQAPGEEALQLFAGMEKIIAEYKRLGMGEAVSRLQTYLEHGKIGDLREYVWVERKGLFSEPGKFFGPADWHTDSSPEMLDRRWSDATEILRLTKENPRSGDLYQRLQRHLDMCVESALSDLQTLKYLSPERKHEHQEILERAKQRLNELKVG